MFYWRCFVCLYLENKVLQRVSYVYKYMYMYTLSIAPSASSQGGLERYHFRVKKCQIYLCICTINIIFNYSIKCDHSILCNRNRRALHLFSEGQMQHPWFVQSVPT